MGGVGGYLVGLLPDGRVVVNGGVSRFVLAAGVEIELGWLVDAPESVLQEARGIDSTGRILVSASGLDGGWRGWFLLVPR